MPNGAFNQCCNKRVPSNVVNVKNMVLNELRTEIKDMLRVSIRDSLDKNISIYIRKEISEGLGDIIKQNINEAISGLKNEIDDNLNNIRASFQELSDTVTTKVKTVEDDLFIIYKELDRMNARVDTLKNDITIAKITSDNSDELANQNSIIGEIEDRLQRKKNLIIYGIREQNQEEDRTMINSALGSLGVDYTLVTSSVRLGKYSNIKTTETN